MKKQRLLIKVLFIILCALAIVGAFMAYRDNVQLSNQLGKIDNVEEKIDSLLNVEDDMVSEIADLQHGIDTLLIRRDSINIQIQTLSMQHDSLISVNDSLIKIAQIQLSGELEAMPGVSELIPAGKKAGLYRRTDIFRSRWPQDLQDVAISLRFDSQYVRLKIDQRTSGGILNVSCRSVDTVFTSDNLKYSCDFLVKGYRIEIITYSKYPINITKMDLNP